MIASANSIRSMRSYKTYNRYINFVKFFYSISFKSNFLNIDQFINWLKIPHQVRQLVVVVLYLC